MKNSMQHISLNAEIRFGKPCIKGARIAVSDILIWLASGMSYEEILLDFPPLRQNKKCHALTLERMIIQNFNHVCIASRCN